MARKKSPTLTEAEYRLMDILWRRGTATVADVSGDLGEDQLAYNTVLSVLRVLERKGYVRHRPSGRAFVYRPVIAREAAQREVVDHVVSRFFNGSPRELMLKLIEAEQVDGKELDRLREIIDAARQARDSRRP